MSASPLPAKEQFARSAAPRVASAALAALLCAVDPAGALEFHVDAATGDDSRSALEAQSPSTPWASIGHALAFADTTLEAHVIHVQSGRYEESVETRFPNIEIRASGGPVLIAPPADRSGIEIEHSDIVLDGLTVEGGTHGIRATTADGLVVRNCTLVGATFDGLRIEFSDGFTVENSRAISNGGRGFILQYSRAGYLRNNLVYANASWGIDIENSTASDPQPQLSTGHVLAFNTIAYNGVTEGGGLRLKNATGEIRDSIIADNTRVGLRLEPAGTAVRNILLHGNDTDLLPAAYAIGGGFVAGAPQFVDPYGTDSIVGGPSSWADDDFSLDPATSPAIDAGSGPIAERDIDGSTRPDLAPDTGVADLGFHAGAGPGGGPPAVAILAATYHVAPHGDDTRTRLAAQDPNQPWATLDRALNSAVHPSDIIAAAAGTYVVSALASTTTDQTLLGAPGAVLQTLDATLLGLSIDHSGFRLEGWRIEGSREGIRITGADDVVLRDVVIDSPVETGVRVAGSARLELEGVTIPSPGERGVEIATSPGALLRDVSVAGGANALRVETSPDLSVLQSDFSAQTLDAIWIFDSDDVRIEDVTVEDCDGNGLTGNTIDRLSLLRFSVTNSTGRAVEITSCPNATVEDLTVSVGQHGVRARYCDGLQVRGANLSAIVSNGVMVLDTSDVLVENSRIDGAGSRGILLERSGLAYVRNNLVTGSGEWGIHFDSESAPLSQDNVVAFNTVVDSGLGGIRFQNATGEIRDNIASANTNFAVRVDTAPAFVHHNLFHQSNNDLGVSSGQEPLAWANRNADPLFVDPAQGDFSLSQIAAGQVADSPAFNTGSGLASELDISGSTRSDAAPDTDVADMGFHADAGLSVAQPPVQTEQLPRIFFVDAASGSDTRSPTQAQQDSTPFASLQRALSEVAPGDTIEVAPGTYSGPISLDLDGLVLRGTGAPGDVVLEPGPGEVGIDLFGTTDVRIENLTISGGSQGVRAEATTGLRLFAVVATGQASLGFHLVDGADAWIDSCIATGAGNHGIFVERTAPIYARNNLVYANAAWGIFLDNATESDPQPAPTTGHVIAFNTVHANGDGIRVRNASAEIRDNQITAQVDLGLFLGGPDMVVHSNNFFGNGRDEDRESSFADSMFVCVGISADPRYVDPAGPDGLLGGANWRDDVFLLSSISAGQAFDSPSRDAGSGPASELDIGGSTSTTGEPDGGTADIGRHEDAPPASSAPPSPERPAGNCRVFFVSPSIGDDSRDTDEAQDPATPWATLRHATETAEGYETVVAMPGSYPESVSLSKAGMTLRSQIPGAASIQPVSGPAVLIEAPGVTVDGLVLRRAVTGILVTAGSNDVRIANCVAAGSSTDGFRASNVSGLIVENSIATGSLYDGISLRQVDGATIRNNLSYANGDWGLSQDNSPATAPLSPDNLIAHNTLAYNGLGNARLVGIGGWVRDNLLTDSPGVGLRLDESSPLLSHNGFANTGIPLDPEDGFLCSGCSMNRTLQPRFLSPTGRDGLLGGLQWADDDFRLEQLSAGQAQQSGAVDFGSDLASTLGVHGSTASSGAIDSGLADVGYHYDSSGSALPTPGYTDLPTDVLYVDGSLGDDGRSRAQAASAQTPWRTLRHALEQVQPGDTLLVAPGTYTERLRIEAADITIRGQGALGEVILESLPNNGPQRPAKGNLVTIAAARVRMENLWIRGGGTGIATRASADGLQLADLVVTGAARDGISLLGGDGISLSGVLATGNRRYGIRVRRAVDLSMRDCLLYQNGSSGLALQYSDVQLSFMTIYGNRDGIRSSGSTATLRDSIVAGHSGSGLRARKKDVWDIHHTLFGANERSDVRAADGALGSGVQLDTDPRIVGPGVGGDNWMNDALYLALDSPAIDAGSDTVEALGVTGSATGGPPDVGIADLGVHR
jgi:parallel beta-helix repeat protein